MKKVWVQWSPNVWHIAQEAPPVPKEVTEAYGILATALLQIRDLGVVVTSKGGYQLCAEDMCYGTDEEEEDDEAPGYDVIEAQLEGIKERLKNRMQREMSNIWKQMW